jgi:hypothetical protein
VAVVPEAKQTQLPVFELAYFDPVAGKYTTLRTSPTPVVVEGEPAPPPAPVPGAAPDRVAAAGARGIAGAFAA